MADPCTIVPADVAFMLMATTFVFIMTPATGLAQAGMIKRKNSLTMLMQTLTGTVIGSFLWFAVGFSLTFGKSTYGIIGNFNAFFLNGVNISSCNPKLAVNVPEVSFLTFHMMFALMAPIIVTGSWAERMRFEAFLLFMILWPFFIYYPLAHWIWNPEGWLFVMGFKDFAGGCVIHASSGVAGFIVSKRLARRERSKGSRKLAQHNLLLSMLGSSLIWGCWYSFNGGSAFAANVQAATALLNTHMAASSGAIVWVLASYFKDKKWHLMELINGAFAGLGSITAGSGYVSPLSAVIIASCGAIASNLWVRYVKPKLRHDDALDVMALQGVPGIIGTSLVGLLSSNLSINGSQGVVFGGPLSFLGIQLLGVLSTILLAAIGTWIVFSIIKLCLGNINVTADQEEIGLDEIQIGEQAYDMKLPQILDIGEEGLLLKLNEACRLGKLDLVKKLIKDGADPEHFDFDGRTPGHLAAAEGHLDILIFLREKFQIDLNATDKSGNTLLADAIFHNHNHICEWLKVRGGHVVSGKGYFVKNNDIFEAVFNNNIDELSYIIATKGNDDNEKIVNLVNMRDLDKRTPLHIAASEGHINVIKYLLAIGASKTACDRWGRTPYQEATRCSKLNAASLLHELSAASFKSDVNQLLNPTSSLQLVTVLPPERVNYYSWNNSTNENLTTPLLDDFASTRNESVERRISDPEKRISRTSLLKRTGSIVLLEENHSSDKQANNINADTVTRNKVRRNSVARIETVSSNGALDQLVSTASSSPLVPLSPVGGTSSHMFLTAAEEGNELELKDLVKKGTDPNICDYDNRTGLHLASARGHSNVVKYLLSKNVNANVCDRLGKTPLDYAIEGYRLECIELLRVAAGKSKKNFVLLDAMKFCEASAAGNIEYMKAKLLEGFDVNSRYNQGRTALHLAASEGQEQSVLFLLENNADKSVKDHFGNTPMDDAKRENRIKCIYLLNKDIAFK